MAAIDTINEHAVSGTKFTDADVTQELADVAKSWVAGYTGNFSYVLSMQARVHKYGLTTAQVRGALNCMVAERKRELDAERPQPEDEARAKLENPTATVEDGIYTVVLGDEHRTIRFRHGRGDSKDVQFISYLFGNNNDNDYACCALVADGTFRWTRAFQNANQNTSVRDAVNHLMGSNDEQRHEAGRAYALKSGNCWICNKTLTDPISIATGVGPICRKQHGITEVPPSPETAASDDFNREWTQLKNEAAKLEAEQEAAAFAADPY